MKVEIGLAHKDARQHLLAAVEGAPYPVTLTAQNHAPSHLFVKFYMAGAGNVGSTVTHTFTRRDEIARWVTDLEQIARQNQYGCICSVDLDAPEPEKKPETQNDQDQGESTSQDPVTNAEVPVSLDTANTSAETPATDSAEKKPVGRPPKTATTPEGGA